MHFGPQRTDCPVQFSSVSWTVQSWSLSSVSVAASATSIELFHSLTTSAAASATSIELSHSLTQSASWSPHTMNRSLSLSTSMHTGATMSVPTWSGTATQTPSLSSTTAAAAASLRLSTSFSFPLTPITAFSRSLSSTTLIPAVPPLPPQSPEEPPIAPVIENTAATMAAVSSVGSLLGVEPSGAATQAALTFMACRRQESLAAAAAAQGNVTFQLWLSTLPLSPFFPLGLSWAAVGNALLAVGVALLHGGCVMFVYALRRRARSSAPQTPANDPESGPATNVALRDVASALRFPSWSLSVGEWLLTGIAVCGAALASDPGSSSTERAVGWACVATSGVFVGLWLFLAWHVAAACRAVPPHVTLRPPPLRVVHAALCARNEWEPMEEVQRSGALFNAMRGHGPSLTTTTTTGMWWWRWACVAAMCVVAAVTGTGGVRGGGCSASLGICAALLFMTALLLAIVRPYKVPTENALNPIKLALLGATSLSLLLLDGPDERTALAALSTLQTFVMVLRLAVLMYLRACEWWCRSATRPHDHRDASSLLPSDSSPPERPRSPFPTAATGPSSPALNAVVQQQGNISETRTGEGEAVNDDGDGDLSHTEIRLHEDNDVDL